MKKNLLCISFTYFFLVLACLQHLLAQEPTISSFAPVKGPVGTLITIKGTNLSNPTAIEIGGVAAITISNTGTQLEAMVMPGAVTGGLSVVTSGGQATGGGNFTITVPKPINIQQGGKLVGSGSAGQSEQGFYSVAISADGNTAITGGPFDNAAKGAAWIFVRSNGTWLQQGAKLVGTGAVGTAFQGVSVGLSADGNTAIVGASGDSSDYGAAWIFTRNNGTWTQQGNKLTGTGGVTVQYGVQEGTYVGLSGDGNTAIIGGPNDNFVGASWIFARNSNNTWVQQGEKLVGSDSTDYDEQGISAALSADGNTAVVGGNGDNKGSGAIWIFAKGSNGVWAQQGAKLYANDATGPSSLGWSVALSADGNTVVTGGTLDNDSTGAAWAFNRKNGIWTQQGNKLIGTGGIGHSQQGSSVSISADGNTIVEGGGHDNNLTGSVWIFKRNGDVWAQQGSKMVGKGAVGAAQQGSSVAISADGFTAISGGPGDSANVGAAWIFIDSASALPVTLTNFSAYQLGKGVQTGWTGYDEINIASYDIERSANGYLFNKIGNLPANGNDGGENNYMWLDASPLTGDDYYRIKAIGNDGQVQYSGIVKITIGGVTPAIQVYPNPTINHNIQLHLNNINVGTYTLAVYDMAGKKVYVQNYAYTGSNTAIAIPVNNAKGIYLVELKGTESTWKTEVLVQ